MSIVTNQLAQEDAKQTVIVLTRDEAKAIAKALNVLAENYFAKPDKEDSE